MPDKESVLRFLLLLAGGVMLTAFLAVLLPTSWMETVHGRLGLGEFPASPLVEYLTRSIALLYGVHGGVIFFTARDVRRFAPVITCLGALHMVFGLVVTGVDLYAGMPLFWTLGEGPPVAGMGLAMFLLSRSIEKGRGA